MARYEVRFTSKFEGNELEEIVKKYLLDKKFRKAIYKEEDGVYKLGSGMMTLQKFQSF